MNGTTDGAVTVTPAAGVPVPPEEPSPHGLGVSLPPADASAKTEGTFPYAADLWAEGLLWAAVLRSPHPRARIVSIDTKPAAEMEGVRAVVTHGDVPGDAGHGRGVADRPVFAKDEVRHHGEPIAAVAAGPAARRRHRRRVRGPGGRHRPPAGLRGRAAAPRRQPHPAHPAPLRRPGGGR